MIATGELTKSGRLNLKVPVTLHSELAALAERERVSLNYLVGVLLAASVRSMQARDQPLGGLRVTEP